MIIIDRLYANRKPRVYKDYAPALRSERSGLEVVEVKKCQKLENIEVIMRFKSQ